MPTAKLLDDFAAGEHIPGVGSATGLAGAIAAALVETVAQLTCSKPKYAEVHPRMRQIQSRARHLRTLLTNAINDDAHAFDRVITARRARDEASTDLQETLEGKVQEALVPATDVLLRVAEASREVSSLGVELFKSGFKSARGDSRTAVALAVASVEGSLCAVELNLRRRTADDEWKTQKRNAAKQLWSSAVDVRSKLPQLFSE